uniref:SPARK domain-containing protein n=1 Tax=Oryza nivara TaxID=4536 RepID=A0A0E0I2A3_ORYNI
MSAHVAAALLLALLLAPSAATDVPSYPLSQAQSPANTSSGSSTSPPCHLDLSAELFGGVAAACGAGGGPGSLDRGRCCPVLAAWLFAAHARTALSVPAPAPALAGEGLDGREDEPMVPYDNQRCVDALGSALERRGVALPRPNATCDTVLCFCGIRLHQIGSLRCPAAFAVGGGGAAAAKNATPTAAVKELEKSCRNASYAGCSRCVQSLQKLKGNVSREVAGGDRARRMLGRDCQLMGLTWLLAKNKTVYIPTVSAVLRAMLYSARPTESAAAGGAPPRCSPDQENMPLAVDSLQFERASATSSSAAATVLRGGGAGVVVSLLLGCLVVFDVFL